MNKSTAIALILGIVLILAVQQIEAGSIAMIIQPVAFLIVIGGTFCASIVNFGPNVVTNAIKAALGIFTTQKDSSKQIIENIIQIAYYARRNGIIALENVISEIEDSFLNRGIQLCLDLNNPQLIRDILEAEISYEEEQELINSRVFEALGGYTPTFGIVGAVMGLIQVMSNMQELDILAKGIATAFVATLYGVGFANLIFLPIAGCLKQRLREKIMLKEVILQGLLSIQMGENPAIIEEKLLAYIKYHNKNHSIGVPNYN